MDGFLMQGAGSMSVMSQQESDQPKALKSLRIHPWVLGPLLFFLVLAGIQVLFIVWMTDHTIDQVEPDAYTRSLAFDAEQAERALFKESGLRLMAQAGPNHQLELRLDGPVEVIAGLREVSLAFYRSSDASLDQDALWADPKQPLVLALPQAGLWRLTLTAVRDGQGIRWSETVSLD